MTQAKICGLTTPDALGAALAGGAAFVGAVVYPKSPRHIDPLHGATLFERARGRAGIVAVTVDADDALLTEIASLRPDAVACFFAGGGAAKFIRDYAAAGLKDKIPLWGSGFLTEGVLDAAGPAADGIMTTMHYSDSLDTPKNKAWRTAYATGFKMQPDVYAVQGYDTGLLLSQGMAAVKGDMSNKPALYKALETQTIDSPRGKWKMSPSHNPIQDIYLRQVTGGENKVIGVAAKQLADPGTGCKMG
mgnify:CR=1 FL=1